MANLWLRYPLFYGNFLSSYVTSSYLLEEGGGEGAAGVYLNIYNDGEGILRGQWHIPAKKWPRYPMGLLTDHVG